MRLTRGGAADAAVIEDGRVTVFPTSGNLAWSSPPGEASTLSYLPVPGVYARTYRDGSVVHFNSATGLMTAIAGRNGDTTKFSYDADERLQAITDPAGFVTQVSWSAARGQAGTATITTPGGRQSVITINGAGDLTTIRDPDNVVTLAATYASADTGRLLSATDRLGGVTTYTYDRYGSVASIKTPEIQSAFLKTIVRSRALALLPAVGKGDGLATPADAVTPDNAWIAMQFPAGDSLRLLTNGAGIATTIATRNAQGKLQTTTTQMGESLEPTSVVSSAGASMNYVWSGPDLISATDLTTNVVVSYEYLPNVVKAYVNEILQSTSYYSDSYRTRLDSMRAGTSVTRWAYDGLGRVQSVADPAGHQTIYGYGGPFQNLTSVWNDGKTVQYGHDTYGRPTSITDPLSQTSTTSYDAVNRVSTVTAPAQGTSTWTYNDVARTAQFTDATSKTYTTSLNSFGGVVNLVHPAGGRDSVAYDGLGRPTLSVNRRGQTIQTTYDILGRPTQVSASTGESVTIAYDPDDRWVAYQNAESADTVFTDMRDRIIRRVSVRPTARFTDSTLYAENGLRESVYFTSPSWSQGRGFTAGTDDYGRPSAIYDAKGRRTQLAYNADQQLSSVNVPMTSGGNYVESYSYGSNDLLATVTVASAPVWAYAYDNLYRQHTQDLGGGDSWRRRTIDYDPAGQLNHWSDVQYETTYGMPVCDDPHDIYSCHDEAQTTATTLRDSTYTWDLVGNPTHSGAVLGVENRLTSYGGFTMTYDDDGNLLTKTGNGVSQQFAWNAFGQLTSVTTNGVTTEYGYDGLGRRVRKTTAGVTTRFVYDGANLAIQTDGAGQPQLEFIYYPGVDHPHSVRVSATGNVYYYLTAQPGHVTTLLDEQRNAVNSYSYAPFGASLGKSEQVPQPFQFAAREFDSESGLYYNRARYYDPSLGRFISEDPIGLAGGVNTYAYTRNDPVNYTDPSGLIDWTIEERACTPTEIERGAQQADFSNGKTFCVVPGMAKLPRVTVTAQRRSGFSPNFGNQDARGRSSEGILDVNRLSQWLSANASGADGACANHVRRGLCAAGVNGACYGGPNAKDYGPFLLKLGFAPLGPTDRIQAGDISVMTYNPYGHVAAYNGRVWISDFIQNQMQPNRRASYPYTIYRKQ